MTKSEIIEGLQNTEELLKSELPVLLAWDAIQAVKEAITFIGGRDEKVHPFLRHDGCCPC